MNHTYERKLLLLAASALACAHPLAQAQVAPPTAITATTAITTSNANPAPRNAMSASPSRTAATPHLTAAEIQEIAQEVYVYAYPAVLMELTRRVMTNVAATEPNCTRAPMNQFCHFSTFPDATFTDVVRPNADTLYSIIWYDVSQEPLLIQVPDSGGRYYLLPVLDMWTDVYTSPGTRTSGNAAQAYAITGPGWSGTLPEGVQVLKSPTSIGWMIGRTQTDGKADYAAVQAFQAGLKTLPLSAYGTHYVAPLAAVDTGINPSAPVEQIVQMSATTFFETFMALLKKNPPHTTDGPILQQMARLGLVAGQPFSYAQATTNTQAALSAAMLSGWQRIKVDAIKIKVGPPIGGWGIRRSSMGVYGNDYLQRALVAYLGLGANLKEDSVYSSAFMDSDNNPFDSGAEYSMHFTKEQLPPVRAFWSLALYNDRQFFTDNPLGRYSIGDRDPLNFNPDGSLDLLIQREPPAAHKQTNWLPAPQQGSFALTIRLYWPLQAVLDQRWVAPAIKRKP